MTGSATPADHQPDRSVGQQVWRAAWRTLALLVALAVAVAAVIYAPPVVAEGWARAFGDPSMRLSPGFVLPTEPAATSVITIGPGDRDLLAGDDVLARAFGGPVRALTTTAAVVAASDGQLKAVDVDGYGADVRWVSTASGVVTVRSPWGDPWLVRLEAGGPVTASSSSARSAVLLRAVDALGWTSGPAGDRVEVATSESEGPDGSREVMAVPRVRSSGALLPSSAPYTRATFDRAGRLQQLQVVAEPVVAVEDVVVPSAAAAWDDARHHRGAPGFDVAEWPAMEASSVRLEPAVRYPSTPESDGFSLPLWVFGSADGQSWWQPVAPLPAAAP